MSRPLLLTLTLALLAAGCVNPAPGAELAPASTTIAAIPATLKAEDATITAVVGGVQLSWEGTVAPGEDLILLATASAAAEYALTLPPEVNLLRGTLAYEGNAPAFFRVYNEDGISMCGGVIADAGKTECFATLYKARDGAEEWRVLVTPSGSAAGEIPFKLDLFLGLDPLPTLGLPAPFGGNASMLFDLPVLLSDDDTHTAEPSIAVSPAGTVYVAAPVSAQRALWRSDDGGKTFSEVQIHGRPTDPLSAYDDGGGDSDVAVSGEDTVYFADQHAAETVSASHDGGATWFTQPMGSGIPLTDRQWLVTDGPMTAYLAFNGPNGATVSKTVDGGHAWVALGNIPEDNCFRGNLARGPDGTLYLGGCNADGPGVATSKDGGLSWTWTNVAKRSGETNTSFFFVAHLFTVVSTDHDGNVYVTWSDEAQKSEDTGAPEGPHGLNIWLAVSKDQGATWSKPHRVNAPDGTYVLPWVTGGAGGKVAVAYYGTKFVGHPERVLGEWYPIVAVTEDALAEDPVFVESVASEAIVQYGPVCMRGSACGNARNLLDFFQIQADSDGMIHMAYVDGTAGGNYRYADVMYVKQMGGISLGGRSVDKDGMTGGAALPIVPSPVPIPVPGTSDELRE